MEIDDKRQGEEKYAASSGTAKDDTDSADTAAANTAAAHTAAAEPLPNPLRGGQDAGGEMGRRRRGWQRQKTDLCVPDLQVLTRNKGKSY